MRQIVCDCCKKASQVEIEYETIFISTQSKYFGQKQVSCELCIECVSAFIEVHKDSMSVLGIKLETLRHEELSSTTATRIGIVQVPSQLPATGERFDACK